MGTGGLEGTSGQRKKGVVFWRTRVRLTQYHWSSSSLVGQLGQSLAMGKRGAVESRGPERAGDPEEIQQKREPGTRGAAPVCREARMGGGKKSL